MSQRRAAYRTDSNQADIVKALRKIGASVWITAGLGDGFPDLIVGYRGQNCLMEVKRSPRSRLTEDERKFLETWRGNLFYVYTPEQAIQIVRDNPQELQV